MHGPANLEGGSEVLDRDLLEAGNLFAGEGIATTLFRARGDAAGKIVDLARLLKAGMIAMATHGRRGVPRLITGSVAEDVARRAEAPVLIHRIGAENEALERKVS
jgi:nucleotide-binding universal stress UspA family protein